MKLSKMYNPMFALCLPHTMKILFIVKKALSTSVYKVEYSLFPITFSPLENCFYIFLALYLSALTIHNLFSYSGDFSH